MRTCGSAAAGFSLIEVLIAIALMITVSVGIAQLFAVALTTGRAAREETTAIVLAAAKLEQLRSLSWAYDDVPAAPLVPRSDVSTNLTVDPPTADGPGLSDGPPGTLDANVPPYVDYLDRYGRLLGGGTAPPRGASFVRRWAVRRLPSAPDRLLALQVFVTTVRRARALRAVPGAPTGEEALVVTVLARKGR